MTTIGITGATGNVGGRVARTLLADGALDAALRVFVRDPQSAGDWGRAEVVGLDYGAPHDDLVAALRGVDTLLFVSGREDDDRLDQHRAVARAAREAEVGHVVYTSFVGASPDATFTLAQEHGVTEQAIAETGLTHTFLRDNFYLDVLPLFAGEDGVIRGPGGSGRVSAVARADVADVASAILVDPGAHRNATYDLTGGEALTLGEVAERASAEWGRSIRYHDETIDEAYASRRAGYPEAPDWELDAWVSTYTAIASGALSAVSPHVEQLTGHAPRSLEDVLAGR